MSVSLASSVRLLGNTVWYSCGRVAEAGEVEGDEVEAGEVEGDEVEAGEVEGMEEGTEEAVEGQGLVPAVGTRKAISSGLPACTRWAQTRVHAPPAHPPQHGPNTARRAPLLPLRPSLPLPPSPNLLPPPPP